MIQEGAYGPLSNEQTQALAKAEKTANELFGMITTLIHLAEISVGGRIRKARFELQELCFPLADRYRTLAKERNLVFKEELLHEDSVGETDKEKLTCLLSHLLDNAFKFTEKGEILFRAKYERDRDCFRFEVKDTGVGFSKEVIPNLTEPFKQRDMSQTRAHGGLGIGLTLVKKYTELLNGKLHISGKEGRGSSFVVEIPARLNGSQAELKVGGWAEGSKPNGGSIVQMQASSESVPGAERRKPGRFSLTLGPMIMRPKWWWRALNSTSP